MNSKKIIFFDSDCMLCNSSVHFILKYNSNRDLYFAPLRSKMATKLLGQLPINTDSIVFYEQGNISILSTAILRICKYLQVPWKFLALLLYLPSFLRDPIYRLIAKFRYRIWGTKQLCILPEPRDRQRFFWEV